MMFRVLPISQFRLGMGNHQKKGGSALRSDFLHLVQLLKSALVIASVVAVEPEKQPGIRKIRAQFHRFEQHLLQRFVICWIALQQLGVIEQGLSIIAAKVYSPAEMPF